MNAEKTKVYTYTRVSTEMQTEGFSLDAQREILHRYCETNNMTIVKEFCDAGISGASTAGRPEFTAMMTAIEQRADDVKYVLVYKLSRFARNTADTLSAVQSMQDMGVNLIVIEENINTSTPVGKMLCTFMATFAELDRANIKEQTMQGRMQKARTGLWNGGIPPYGYKVVDSKLVVDEEEALVVKKFFELYTTSAKGVNGIIRWLNANGFKKQTSKHRRLNGFTGDFVRRVLKNPVYCGDIVYRRTTTETLTGKRGKNRRIQAGADLWVVNKDSHPALIDRETFEKAQLKLKLSRERYLDSKKDADHVNLLTGILKCPVCGASLYGNSRAHKRADGTYGNREYFYRCINTRMISGHKCSFRRQFSQAKLNAVVENLIISLVDKPEFATMIQEKISAKVDIGFAEEEVKQATLFLEKEKRRLTALENDIDDLDPSEANYDDIRKRLNERYSSLCARVADAEKAKQEKLLLLQNIRSQVVTLESIYAQLKNFRQIYDKMSEQERRVLMNTLIRRIELNLDSTRDARTFIKEIYFQFPIVQDADGTLTNWWKNETTVENVALIVRA